MTRSEIKILILNSRHSEMIHLFLNPNIVPNGLIKSCVKNKGASNALASAETIWCLSAASSKRQLENLIFLA
jgi:hypothetical protein